MGGISRRSVAAVVLGVTVACGSAQAGEAERVRLGLFPNVTHAPALVGVSDRLFQTELGSVQLEIATFNAGTEAIEALFAGALDMTFIGPNPAINAHAQSDGAAIRIVSGTTSGGAALVVRGDITETSQLAGTTLATPSLGNTQDVALRAYLLDLGLTADLEGGGDVSIVPQSNAQTLETFIAGGIDGAWVPEPWATRLIVEGGGAVLVDEKDLWPDGQFVTTNLIVRTEFLEQNPDIVSAVLRGLVRAIDVINADPGGAQQKANQQIEEITGSALSDEVMSGAWANLTFTLDPIADSLRKSADDAVDVGLLEPVDLAGIYALDLLDTILTDLDRPKVSS
jgi:NitT/TauT family transport system substrate-binding protein